MLQRIQTVYLLAIVILSGITFFSPLAELINQSTGLVYVLDFKGLYLVQAKGNVYQSGIWDVNAVAAIIPLLALCTIFLYKKRMVQIRLSVINMFLMVGYYILLFVNLWMAGRNLSADWSLKIASIFPVICIILNYLAIGGIGKDEALVKSMDRIR